MIENVSDGQPVNRLKKMWANPNVRLAASVALEVATCAAVGFLAYQRGTVAGRKQGEVRGYASALTEIGVTPAEVPTLAAAWQETRTQYAEALNKAEALPA